MKAKEKIMPAFLTGGGEMGELIRSFDWSKTAIGSPDTWPQSLRIAVRIMLDCPFGMYIAWGKEYIQLYNDGYRPILGATKHPQALGTNTRKTFEEIWPTIGPMFDGVMQGTPVGFPDFILHLDRNGFVEECVFDFSYSPIRLEDGEVGGVLVTVIETTEKVKAVKALKESLEDVSLAKFAIQKSEENLRSTILQAPVAMCIFKGENFIVDLANDRMFELWGKPANEVINKPIFEGLPETKDQGFEAILQGVYTTGKTFSADGVPITLPRNGVIELVYVNFVYEPYREADGTVSGIVALAFDVTTQLTASKKIEESEQNLKRYKHMADNANEAFILMRQDGTFAYLNDLALERWGYSREEAQHIRVPDVDPIYNDEVFNAAFAASQKEKLPQFETLHKKKDGTIYPVEVNMGGLTLEGKPHMFAIARDITERKKLEEAVHENEEKIRSFILQAPVAMALYRGPQHIIEIVNDELLAIWDKPLASVINKPVFEALPEARGQGFEALLDKVYTTGEKFTSYGIPIILPRNGKPKTIYVNLVYQAYREADGTISGIVEVVSDATEQVVATQQIEASEKRFSMLADSIPNLAWMAYADGNIFWYNKKWFEYTDTILADMEGWGWQSVHDPEELPKVLTKWKVSIETGQPFEMVFPLKGADGKFRQFLTRVLPVLDSENKIYRWFGTNTDISKQIEAEEKIKESEAKFRTLSETIPHMVWTATPDGKKNFFNKFFLDYTGLSFEELEGDDWKKIIFADDLENELKQWHQALKTGEDFKIEKRILCHDGTYQWHLCHGIAQKDKEGTIIGWIGTNTDITEQKSFAEELEEKVKERTYQLHIQNETFKQAEESSMQGSYSFNLTTGKLAYSDNLYRLIGYEPNEFEPSLEEFNGHVHPEDRDYVQQAAEKVLQSKTADEWYYRMNTKNGNVINIKGTGRVIESGDEKLLVGTLQDVTKDVLASKELKTKNVELENANAELASFSYVASHDLQEPLRKIQGFSKRISDKEAEHLSDTAKDYFNRINAAAQRMQKLIESLLSFSRTNTVEIVFVKTDLNQTLNEVKAALHETIKEKNAVIESQQLPTLNAVPVQMHQLFLNLIGNALKYSKHDVAPLIKITAEQATINEIAGRVKQNGTFWKIVISDNGIGFEQQYENKIFELFQRLHGKTEYEGTGIGLAICKKIVQSHNGIITATGQTGIGATFTFFLSDNNKS
ncbi:MAG: PAS domain S-box protein [Bacteroidia bacterium]